MPSSQADLQEVVIEFNRDNMIGAHVQYWTGVREGRGKFSTTRTAAELLNGHTPVIWVDGEASCIALTHVQPVPGRHEPAGDDVKPRMLVYFCCQGGACKGYENAGFDVEPVDINPQPHHYAPGKVVVADALAHLRDLITTGEIRRYAAVGGSPPCQRKTRCQKIQGRDHPALIAPFRELCLETGLPYVIENVVADGEDDDPLKDPVLLCGAMFGLHTYRHRLFESNAALVVPEHPGHIHPTVKMGRPLREGDWYHAVGNFSNVPYVRTDMGVPWMTRDGIREAIPPVYAEHIGRQLMAHVGVQAVTA